MNGLSASLIRLSNQPLPDGLSADDQQLLRNILESSLESVRPFDGEFRAPWLLSEFEAATWHTTNRGREEFIDGHWQNTVSLNWDQVLPDGLLLTDPGYATLLEAMRRAAWLCRSGLLTNEIFSARTWRFYVYWLIRLGSWLVFHRRRYQPETMAFAALDQAGLTTLLTLIASGGWFEAFQCPQRLLMHWHENALGLPCADAVLESPNQLPAPTCHAIVEWLDANGWYVSVKLGVHKGTKIVNRDRVASYLNLAQSVLKKNKAACFLRQFEPDLGHVKVLVGIRQNTEYPDQGVPTRDDAAREFCTESLVKEARQNAELWLGAHRHLPEMFPDSSGIDVRQAESLAFRSAKFTGHTSFMPVDTALTYLREAIRWVHVYGEAIVAGVLATAAEAKKLKTRNLPPPIFTGELKAAFARILPLLVSHTGCELQPLSSLIGLQMPKSSSGDFERFRRAPTMIEALDVLVGACLICVSIMKPSRREELGHLQRDCLLKSPEGYYLRFELGKSNTGEAYQQRDKPVPLITARAIELLQRLGQGLCELFGERRKIKDSLFYLPSCMSFGPPNEIGGSRLFGTLDRFCDYVGISPVKGRRWYVRVHEMRKWFLLLMFWSGRFDVLDAVRWIAGHTDGAHTWAYLEASFPGEELPGLEAEYSVDRIRRLDEGMPASADERDLDELYRRVCEHFSVNSLSMVPESEWAEYITALRKMDGFELEPHTIYGRKGHDVVGLGVSFVLREVRT